MGSPETKDPMALVVDADKNQKEVKRDQDESETYTFYQSADGQLCSLRGPSPAIKIRMRNYDKLYCSQRIYQNRVIPTTNER